MFDGRAFRTWGHVVMGACIVSSLFLGLMLMAEEVAGRGARLSRAVVTVTAAAFLGYLGTAWIIRRDRPAGRDGEGTSGPLSDGGRR
ncbi:MAG: ABC transporter permease [Salinibacter sp.]